MGLSEAETEVSNSVGPFWTEKLYRPSRWRTLQHIIASPSKIGDIARSALVLTQFEYGYIT